MNDGTEARGHGSTGVGLRLAPCVGFTLIELVFVALALMVLMTFSLPGFYRTARRLRAEQSAFELMQLLRSARERAVAQGLEVCWSWDPEARRAQLNVVSEAGELQPLEERLAHSAVLPDDLAVSLIRERVAVEAVCFFPDGTSEASTLLVTHAGGVYTVTVDAATGGVSLVNSGDTGVVSQSGG